VLFKLDELVRPYVHKILVVIEPLLIDEDYYARVEGRCVWAECVRGCAAGGVGGRLFGSPSRQVVAVECSQTHGSSRPFCSSSPPLPPCPSVFFLPCREIIANLAKAAGLATMIAAMRPDIDNVDEYVRNTTARAFSVVASALGIPALLPFLKAVCQSKKSWQARHTGIKIVQQIAILMGCAVLPHLKSLVDIVKNGEQVAARLCLLWWVYFLNSGG
jgi:splicing factor 3B subunit 1